MSYHKKISPSYETIPRPDYSAKSFRKLFLQDMAFCFNLSPMSIQVKNYDGCMARSCVTYMYICRTRKLYELICYTRACSTDLFG